jgi:hypothetical protein
MTNYDFERWYILSSVFIISLFLLFVIVTTVLNFIWGLCNFIKGLLRKDSQAAWLEVLSRPKLYFYIFYLIGITMNLGRVTKLKIGIESEIADEVY